MIEISYDKNKTFVNLSNPQHRAESDIDFIVFDKDNKKVIVNSISTHENIEHKFKSKEARDLVSFIKEMDSGFDYNLNVKTLKRKR